MMLKNWITTLMGSMILTYGVMAYGGPNEEPKTKNEIEVVENIGTYPLRGGETPSVEYGRKIGLSENVSLHPFVEVADNYDYSLALKLLCPECPEDMFEMLGKIVGGGSELEVKLNDNISVYGRGAVGKNGDFYTSEMSNPGSSYEFGGGMKFDFELFGKDIEFKVGESYNNQFGPMTTGGFVIHL